MTDTDTALLDAEAAFLGCLLASPEQLPDVAPAVQADDFAVHRHRWIYEALQACGETADIVTVAAALEQRHQLGEIGGTAYLARLLTETPNSYAAEAYGELVAAEGRRRKLAAEALRFASALAQPGADVDTATHDHRAAVEALSARQTVGVVGSMAQAVDEYYTDVERYVRTGAIPGLTTGFSVVDKKTLGMKRGELLILAARPSMGKTSLAAQMSVRQARTGLRVGVFALEGQARGWVDAAAGADLGLNKQTATADDLARIADKCQEFYGLPIAFYERGYSAMPEIESAARQMAQALDGLDVLWFDHLGYIDHTRGQKSTNLPYQIGQTTKRLAALAKTYDAAVACLCQLNRASAVSKDEPTLTDLRDSGEIEQDARQVWFIHRPGYYADPEPPANVAQEARLLVRKNHDGATGRIDLAFVKNVRRFQEPGL